MECKKINQYGQSSVIPIFYDVDPSTVREQKESFAESLKKHESRFKVNEDVEGMQKVQKWRTALTDAADLKGHDICQGIEEDCIQQIVDQIWSRFCMPSSSNFQRIVGIKTHLEKVKSLLEIEVNNVKIVGICGIGGVGKTTIARAIFEILSCQFEVACFLADVKENKSGMHMLQNTLFSELLPGKGNYASNKEVGKNLLAQRLCSMKVLIVLDDVDRIDHLDYLAGDLDWFGSGSRIIVTTRDRHLMGKNDVYEVTPLVNHEALQLFNQCAFKEERPDESFNDLTLEVVSHAKDLPLALKVLGCHLYNRDINEWRSAIEEMRKHSKFEIVDKLKISYNGLEPLQQEMFLDLACFLRGKKRGVIKQILESCDFEVDIGLRVLIEKCLVFISDKDTIEMHDYIQEMGKSVVNMQKIPGKRSRLWLAKDIEELMDTNTGTEEIEAIWVQGEINFTKEAMINMRSLRILHIVFRVHSSQHYNGSTEYLSNKLRWLVWDNYPWGSLPANFEPKRLVHLQLESNSLRYLWTGIKHLPYLRTLDLSFSKTLTRTPDFTGMPNLEYLNLKDCRHLEEVSNSLGRCRKLIRLSLLRCFKLESLPEEIGDLENLEGLDASCTAISQPPSSIVRLNKLKFLSFSGSSIFTWIKFYVAVYFKFPQVGEGLCSLEYLNLGNCNLIDGGLPENIGCLSSLKELNLMGNNFEQLPRSITQLGALRSLDLKNCHRLKELPELPPRLDELSVDCDVILKHIHSLATKKKFQRLIVNDSYKVDSNYDDSIYNSFAHALYQILSSKQQDISASDSLSQRVFTIERPGRNKIPSWFHYQGVDRSVSVNLPEDWYACDNFLGFAVGYAGSLTETAIHLIPLCDDGEMSWMTHKLALHSYLKPNIVDIESMVHFLFVPLAGLWDTSKANGKTPNDYGHLRIFFSGENKKYGLRLLYKDEPELKSEDNDKSEPEGEHNDESEPESEDDDEPECESLLQMREN